MVSKSIAVIVIAFFGIASAHVIREAPQTNENGFSEIVAKVSSGLQELEQFFLKANGVENREQLQAKITDDVKKVSTDLDSVLTNIKEKTEQLGESKLVQNARKNIDELTNDLKAKHPKTVEELNNFVSTATNQIEKIAADLKSSENTANLQKIGEDLLKDTSDVFKKIVEDINTNLNKKN